MNKVEVLNVLLFKFLFFKSKGILLFKYNKNILTKPKKLYNWKTS